MEETGGKVLKVRCKPKLFDHVVVASAEFLGTAVLLFLSCAGACLQIQGEISSMHISFNSGLTVMAAIQIFGHISGAHINPVVTLSALISNEITPMQAPIYIVSQILGCLVGCGLQVFLTPWKYIDVPSGSHGVCVTAPNGAITHLQALGMETMLSAILVFCICATWDRRNSDKTDSVPLRIGLVVVVLNLAAGAYTGASMNPVRSFGPAVWSGDYTAHWVYWVGPTIGSLIATYFYKFVILRRI